MAFVKLDYYIYRTRVLAQKKSHKLICVEQKKNLILAIASTFLTNLVFHEWNLFIVPTLSLFLPIQNKCSETTLEACFKIFAVASVRESPWPISNRLVGSVILLLEEYPFLLHGSGVSEKSYVTVWVWLCQCRWWHTSIFKGLHGLYFPLIERYNCRRLVFLEFLAQWGQ